MKKFLVLIVIVILLVFGCEKNILAPTTTTTVAIPEDAAELATKRSKISALKAEIAGDSPVSRIMVTGEKASVLTVQFVAMGSSYTIKELGFSVGKKITSIDFLEINGTVAYPNRNNIARFAGLNIFVPASGLPTKVVLLVQIKSQVKSGEEFRVALDKKIIAYDQNGNKVTNINELLGSKTAIRETMPIISRQLLSGPLQNGRQQVFSFSVTADAAGDLRLAGFTFNQEMSLAVTCSDFFLEQPLTGRSWPATSINSGAINIVPEQEIVLAAGTIQNFCLVADVIGATTGSYLKCQLANLHWHDGQAYYNSYLVPGMPTGWQILSN